MNRVDKDRINELITLWMTYHDKQTKQDEIAVSGPTQESKMMEYKGDFPQLSNVKPEILVGKVDKMRRIPVSKEEVRAAIIIDAFPDRLRNIMTGYEQRKNQYNPVTQKPWTHDDIALVLKVSRDSYKRVRLICREFLLEMDRTQDVVSKSKYIRHILLGAVA